MFDFKHAQKASLAHKEIICDNLTPLSILSATKARVLLESAYNETGKDRYSLVVLNEAFRIYKDKMGQHLIANGRKVPLKEALKGYKQAHNWDFSHDFLYSLSLVRSLAPNPQGRLPSHLPLPLGGAGYIGYEFFAEIEEIDFTNPPLYDAPECAFIFGRDFLIFDHLFDRLHIVSVSYAHEREQINPQARIEHIMSLLEGIPRLDSIHTDEPVEDFTIIDATSASEYEAVVERIKAHIYAGDLLQCVPSQSMQVHSSLSPLQAYRHLRFQNPSPYMFYYDFDDFVVLGASPEIMIRLKTHNERSFFTLRPIAGTRARGENMVQDLALEEELLRDEKENAEHLMLLDLARNDAGKVSVGGGVKVLARNQVERYSRVMHIVSEVQGELDSKIYAKRDAFKSVFPAGTLSGAPKIEAIKTIEALESTARGIYGGAIGYFTYDEDMDFAIAIRTAVYQNGIYYLRSGAGVVQDSIPAKEYIETQSKVRSMLDMLCK
ncbi:anthranilate synthase component I family protein [Helicobacter jaachi]|uniref:Anthranilate synthase component 1 n=1 Tax=Helicobacter jaachi TaxID=1677920 RepID=A0A4U8TAP5_9HELI|nr:anthranilate synthase component I family protein [Helicobacter jaachi]TLD96960.1 anthranilate synthase component I family protein [Helicobacter jaachi]